jgi:hypothetical protein
VTVQGCCRKWCKVRVARISGAGLLSQGVNRDTDMPTANRQRTGSCKSYVCVGPFRCRGRAFHLAGVRHMEPACIVPLPTQGRDGMARPFFASGNDAKPDKLQSPGQRLATEAGGPDRHGNRFRGYAQSTGLALSRKPLPTTKIATARSSPS